MDRPATDTPYVSVTVPLRTYNPLNGSHGHWRAVSRRGKQERDVTALSLIGVLGTTWEALAGGCVIVLTRVAPRPFGNDEALMASLKRVRDVVAQRIWGGTIGQRDDDGRGTWTYRQVKGPRGVYEVQISIEPRA